MGLHFFLSYWGMASQLGSSLYCYKAAALISGLFMWPRAKCTSFFQLKENRYMWSFSFGHPMVVHFPVCIPLFWCDDHQHIFEGSGNGTILALYVTGESAERVFRISDSWVSWGPLHKALKVPSNYCVHSPVCIPLVLNGNALALYMLHFRPPLGE